MVLILLSGLGFAVKASCEKRDGAGLKLGVSQNRSLKTSAALPPPPDTHISHSWKLLIQFFG